VRTKGSIGNKNIDKLIKFIKLNNEVKESIEVTKPIQEEKIIPNPNDIIRDNISEY
jgi:hypothetical protein